jgi:mRNA interferase RelE/StbE
MRYEVGFKPAAFRQLRKLSKDVQPLIVAAIEALADDPRPTGYKKLKGDTALYRICIANTYRIIYEIQDRQLCDYSRQNWASPRR